MQLVAERPDGVSIIRCDTLADGLEWRAAFVGAYQAIWSEPPYNEHYSPDEAASVLRRALEIPDNITLLAVRPSGIVVGFGIAYPVVARPDVVREVRGLLPIDRTVYFAELGVVEDWRRRALGHELIDHRLHLVDRRRYTHVLLRTSAVKNETYRRYHELGFEDTGVYMEVSQRRVDGSTRTDRRLFMAKVLGAGLS